MNKKNIQIIFYCSIIISQLCQTIIASQYAPNIYYSSPFKADPYLSNPSLTLTAGFANEAYDRNGNLVPFLQQYGAEDFLQRFVDPSLGPDSLETAGQGHISGKYHFKQYNFSYEQNIYHKLIFGIIASLQDLSITDITPEFIPTETPLSPDQILYLEKLERVIPKTISQYGLNTVFMYFGYNDEITHFTHINSLKTLLIVSMATPQWMKDSNRTALQFPCAANIHFGYPVIGTISAEIRDWFECGFCGLVSPMQPAYTTIAINRTSENNHLLFSQSTQVRIDQKPFFSGTIYAEFKDKTQVLVGTIGYSYSQYMKSEITPIDTVKFPKAHANKSLLLDGYTLGALLLQLDIDCSREEKTVAPIVSLFFSVPVVGKLYQKTYLFGGTCNLQVSYDF